MKKLIFLFLLLAGMSFGQTTVAPFLSSKIQLLDNSGVVCSGCLLDTFAAGTTTPLATYSESTGTSLNANPVVLDSAGRATVYLTSASYKFRLRSALGVTLWTQDVISWNTPLTTFAGISDAGNLTQTQPTAATNVANQSSFSDCMNATYWTGSVSATDSWCLQDILGTGTNPTSTFTLTHSGSSGATNFSIPGNMTVGAASFGQSDSTGYIISAKDLTGTILSTVHVSHHATLSGAYGIEIHNYNSCGTDCLGVPPTVGVGATNAFVIHQYSQVVGGAAVQFDNTGPSTILVLKNAVNATTSFGTIGTGDFIDFVGFSSGSPGTPVALGHLSNGLQFGTDDSTTTWTFGDGVAALSGVSGPRSALAVTSANATHAAVTISNSVSNLYAETLNSQNFGDNITCATNSGECLHVEKDGVGAGTVLNIVNKGSGNSIQATDGTTTKFAVDSTGKVSLATLTGATTGNNVSVLNAQGAVAALTGNSADQVVYTYSLPANTIDTTSKGVRITCGLTHNSGTANVAVKININGVVAVNGNIGTTAAQSVTDQATIIRTASTTAGSIGIATVTGALNPFTLALTGLAWTSSQTITCTFNVANTDQITGNAFLVEQIQ